MISIIDIEASGFGPNSYPIEVGVVTKNQERYCALIRPYDDWTHWSSEAEKLHGISREQLQEKGTPPHEVCFALNNMLKTTTVYCDAWVQDSAWLRTLFYRSAIAQNFTISAIESVAKEEQLECWDSAKQEVVSTTKFCRHRASNDAMIIQKTFEKTYQKL